MSKLPQAPEAVIPTLPLDFSEWARLHAEPAARVLKLALLKRWSADLHLERSRRMAHSETTVTGNFHDLERWERHFQWVSEAGLDAPVFPMPNQLMMPADLRSVREPSVPPNVPLGWLSGFSRMDRTWERAIYAEAIRWGWLPATLLAEVQLERVMEFHTALESKLALHGCCLWTESATDQRPRENYWTGYWRCVVALSGSELATLIETIRAHFGAGLPRTEWRMESLEVPSA